MTGSHTAHVYPSGRECRPHSISHKIPENQNKQAVKSHIYHSEYSSEENGLGWTQDIAGCPSATRNIQTKVSGQFGRKSTHTNYPNYWKR